MAARSALLALLLLALAIPFAEGSPVGADTHVVAREVPGLGFRYAPAHLVVDVAGSLTLTNTDLAGHDLVSVADGPETNTWCARFTQRDCPLFASPIIGLGAQTEVAGIDALPASGPSEGIFTYDYYCSVHPWMRGTITTI